MVAPASCCDCASPLRSERRQSGVCPAHSCVPPPRQHGRGLAGTIWAVRFPAVRPPDPMRCARARLHASSASARSYQAPVYPRPFPLRRASGLALGAEAASGRLSGGRSSTSDRPLLLVSRAGRTVPLRWSARRPGRPRVRPATSHSLRYGPQTPPAGCLAWVDDRLVEVPATIGSDDTMPLLERGGIDLSVTRARLKGG